MEEKEQLDRIEEKIDNIVDLAGENKFSAKTKVVHLFLIGLTVALFYSAIIMHVYLGGVDNLPLGLLCFGVMTGICYFFIVLLDISRWVRSEVDEEE